MKGLIKLLKINAWDALIPKEYIASYFAGAYEFDDSGRLKLRDRFKCPAIAIQQIHSMEVPMTMGNSIGRYSPKKGAVYRSIVHVDCWGYDTLQRDQLAGWSENIIMQNLGWLRANYGIVKIQLISQFPRGMDPQDRILQGHSHQNMDIMRMVDEYEVIYVAEFQSFAPRGIISKANVTISGTADHSLVVGVGTDIFPYFFDDELLNMV